MEKFFRTIDPDEKAEYYEAFERVITLWEELEKKGLFATARLEHMIIVFGCGKRVSALAVLIAFQDCPKPLPDRLRKITRYLDFRDCVTYADLAKFLAAVNDLLGTSEPSAGAKLH